MSVEPKAAREDEAHKPNRYRIEAVDRALLLLDAVAANPGATAAQLATARDANRSLVFRMLSTLADRGFVTKDQHNNYRLGPRLLSLAEQAGSEDLMVDASREALDRLLAETQENIYLIVREGLEVLCVATRISPQKVRVVSDVGFRRTIGVGSAALVIMAYADRPLVDAVLDFNYAENGPPTWRTREEVEIALPIVRKAGFHETRTDEPDIYSVSAPVWDWRGEVAAVIVLDAPLHRVPVERAAEIRARLLHASEAISTLLGGRAPA